MSTGVAVVGWGLIGAGCLIALTVAVVRFRERQHPELPRVRASETRRGGAHRAATASSWIATHPYRGEAS